MGGAEAATDDGDAWLFPTLFGYAGEPGPMIRVDKRTGATSAPGLPTVTDPAAAYGFVQVRRYAQATPEALRTRTLKGDDEDAGREDGDVRLGKPREETTFASNPGGIRLKPLHYARFFPDALRRLTLEAC